MKGEISGMSLHNNHGKLQELVCNLVIFFLYSCMYCDYRCGSVPTSAEIAQLGER